MKIRDKLLLGFGLYIVLAVILGFFTYRALKSISTSLVLVETADDITNSMLEVRRYEKNFLLYKDPHDLQELKKFLDMLQKAIDNIRAEIITEIQEHNYTAMKQAISGYEQLIDRLAQNFASQGQLVSRVINVGRNIESRMAKRTDLVSFLRLRRYERNIMLYRNSASWRAFAKEAQSPDLFKYPQIENYRDLMYKLYQLYEDEGSSVDRMRLTAREIQSFTENLAKEERDNIHTMVKMSINLLLVALVLILLLGTIINVKLATSIAGPIRTLEKIAKKISEGDFSETIEVKGKDELASLEIAFNQMEERLKNALWSLEHTIEKLREKQAQLVEAEKLALVGKLAAGIAHEINNPLTAVLTFSNLMLEQCPPSDPRHDKLKLMVRETGRARNIVRQLLNFGREIVIKPVKININQPVSEIADSLIAQDAFKGIELTMNLGKNLPEIDADPAQIGQVVMNILLNAIQAITAPGKIEIATGLSDRNVEIIFSDTGAGIPEEHLRKIFDPFFTTKTSSSGTGLGLAVSYGIIKKHGGDIEVASTLGQGTTFMVRLPIAA